jgi:hypothetical protein
VNGVGKDKEEVADGEVEDTEVEDDKDEEEAGSRR